MAGWNFDRIVGIQSTHNTTQYRTAQPSKWGAQNVDETHEAEQTIPCLSRIVVSQTGKKMEYGVVSSVSWQQRAMFGAVRLMTILISKLAQALSSRLTSQDGSCAVLETNPLQKPFGRDFFCPLIEISFCLLCGLPLLSFDATLLRPNWPQAASLPGCRLMHFGFTENWSWTRSRPGTLLFSQCAVLTSS